MTALVLLFGASGCVSGPPGASSSGPTSYDDRFALTSCIKAPMQGESTAAYPAMLAVPQGHPGVAGRSEFTVTAPAAVSDVVRGNLAHGKFILVEIRDRYLGDVKQGPYVSPYDFQLVDRNGVTHCAMATPTSQLFLDRYPDKAGKDPTGPGADRWYSFHVPPGTSFSFTLVFDVDPALVDGVYLLGFDESTHKSVSLELGIHT